MPVPVPVANVWSSAYISIEGRMSGHKRVELAGRLRFVKTGHSLGGWLGLGLGAGALVSAPNFLSGQSQPPISRATQFSNALAVLTISLAHC